MKPWYPVPPGRKAMPDGVTLYPFERLGNQLFSYAAVYAQARRQSVPCYVNKAFFEHVRPERTYNYEYELDVFDNGLVIPHENAYHLPVFMGFPTVQACRWWHNRLVPAVPGAGKPVFMEQGFGYDSRLRDVVPGTTVIGGFQSWRYFDDCATEICDRLMRLSKPSDWYQEMCERIQPGTGNIGLHVRRGDYMLAAQQKIQGLTSVAYYERALALVRRLGYEGPAYLSTDSPSIVHQEFSGMGAFIDIDPPPGVHPFEVVLVLSRMDALVIANSSFSWWAGYIGERPGRVVIAPRPWFTMPGADTNDLLPPHWLTIDRNNYK